jgi:hypothetical protein
MEAPTIRISIELPTGVGVDVSGGTTDDVAARRSTTGSTAPIDAGPPAAALVAALGDPEDPAPLATPIEVETAAATGGPIDAGGFPAQLAADMEAEGPRQPGAGRDGTRGTSAMSPMVGRESRN